MSHYALPALYGLLIWWSSTCIILFLDNLPQRTYRWSMIGATVTLLGCYYGLVTSASDTTIRGAYTAFTSALLIWGWLEISFYTGYVTGPRKTCCHSTCSGFRHLGHAIQASLYHELAVLLFAAVVVTITWGKSNQFGCWTFIVLWWMHQSSRLNVFLGVSNLNADFLPEHLAYLRGFFRSAPMNLLFPFSVTASTICAVIMAQQVAGFGPATFEATGYILLTTLMVLAVLEHWALVLPISFARIWNRMWRWSSRPYRLRAPMQQARQCPSATQATIGGRS